jgi:hypothetical protein
MDLTVEKVHKRKKERKEKKEKKVKKKDDDRKMKRHRRSDSHDDMTHDNELVDRKILNKSEEGKEDEDIAYTSLEPVGTTATSGSFNDFLLYRL